MVHHMSSKRSGLINQLILRCKNKKDYYITKFIVTFINGGTIAAIPIVASLIISMCVAPWGIPVYSVSFYSVGRRAVFAELFYKHSGIVRDNLHNICIYIIWTA